MRRSPEWSRRLLRRACQVFIDHIFYEYVNPGFEKGASGCIGVFQRFFGNDSLKMQFFF